MEEKLNKTIDLLVECAKNCEKFDEDTQKNTDMIRKAIETEGRLEHFLKEIEKQIAEIESAPVYDKYEMDILETLYKKQRELEWFLREQEINDL